MSERLLTLWQNFEWTWAELLWSLAGCFFFFLLSTGVVIFLVIRIPPTFFRDRAANNCRPTGHPLVRASLWLSKNILGTVLVITGLILALPGVPGPGLLVMLFGIVLLEFPGKRQLEQKLVRHPRVLEAINRIRARFHRQPLEV